MAISRTWIAIGVSLSVQACALYYADHYGLLSGLLRWDDCGVLLRGYRNLDLLAHANSLFDAFRAVHNFDIHAPLSDAQTIIGILIAGGQPWGPFLLNAVWLALALTAILNTINHKTWALTIAVILFILVQPLTFNALTNVKSDWNGGLLLAGALFVLSKGTEKARPYLKLLGATLLGLSILSKLTAFYLPVLALGVLLLFEWHSALISAVQRTGSVLSPLSPTKKVSIQSFVLTPVDRRMFALYATISVGPFILCFVWKFRATINYIRDAVGNRWWDDGFTMLERAGYYSPLGGSSGYWGNLHVFFLVFVGTAIWVAWRRRDFGYPILLIIFCFICGAFFVPLIVPQTSNPEFGATFLGVVIAATLVSVDFIALAIPRWGGLAVLAITVLIALPPVLPFAKTNNDSGTYNSRELRQGSGTYNSRELRQVADTYGRIVDTISEHSHWDTTKVVVLYEYLLAAHPNLAIKYFLKTGRLPVVERVDDISRSEVKSQLENAEFVLSIAPVPSVNQSTQLIPGLFPSYPTSHDPARGDAFVFALGRFDLIGTFPVRGGEIHLYRNRGGEPFAKT
jgi:hypothetical protein